MIETKRNYPALRLVVSREPEEEHRERCSESNLSAASPRGDSVRPCSISLTEEAANPTRSPMSASVNLAMDRKSVMRDAHVVMTPSVRKTESRCQRKADSVLRNNGNMPRPKDMPSNLLTVGKRVRWWREHRSFLDQRQFAKEVGVAPSTLSDLENDRQSGSRKLHLIAAKLGLNPHYLETGKGEPEAEHAQEAPAAHPEWPFEAISLDKLNRLNPIERSYAETKLLEALTVIEAERRKAKKAG